MSNVFDTMVPITNPRRYLKVIDHTTNLLTEKEIQDKPFGLQPEKSGKSRIGTKEFSLRAFLIRFFAELRSITPTLLVQPLDDEKASAPGVFLQTKTMVGWDEYKVIASLESHEVKQALDLIIRMWKYCEKCIQNDCFEQLSRTPLSAHTDTRLLLGALSYCNELVEKYKSLPANSMFRPSAREFNNAMNNLSVRFRDVLRITDSLAKGMVMFILNLENILHAGPWSLATKDIPGVPIQICGDIFWNHKALDISDIRNNYELSQLADGFADTIKGWFSNLELLD